ncbi:MAG TPA: hypothetical protein DER32_09750, partial [Deinococcus radiodurans]|nr:hypothetical protein [Deinococcus radiodurans]
RGAESHRAQQRADAQGAQPQQPAAVEHRAAQHLRVGSQAEVGEVVVGVVMVVVCAGCEDQARVLGVGHGNTPFEGREAWRKAELPRCGQCTEGTGGAAIDG